MLSLFKIGVDSAEIFVSKVKIFWVKNFGLDNQLKKHDFLFSLYCTAAMFPIYFFLSDCPFKTIWGKGENLDWLKRCHIKFSAVNDPAEIDLRSQTQRCQWHHRDWPAESDSALSMTPQKLTCGVRLSTVIDTTAIDLRSQTQRCQWHWHVTNKKNRQEISSRLVTSTKKLI